MVRVAVRWLPAGVKCVFAATALKVVAYGRLQVNGYVVLAIAVAIIDGSRN